MQLHRLDTQEAGLAWPCPRQPREVSVAQLGTKAVDATSRDALAMDFEALDK